MSLPKDHPSPHVAVLFYRIGPYHYARLKAAGAGLRVTAVEFSNVDPTYAWDPVSGADQFDRLTLFSDAQISALSPRHIYTRVCTVLDQLRPQVVAIPGWADRCSLAALRWCRAHGVPAVLMSETTAWDDRRKWWKEMLKRRLVGLFSSALVGGRPHADYLEQLGFDPRRISFGYDAVDNDYFTRGAAAVRSALSTINSSGLRSPVSGLTPQPCDLRTNLGLPEHLFLASARFVEKKNLSRLLQAYARYRQLAEKSEIGNRKSEIWSLVLLGDGPLRSTLNSQLSTLNLRAHVQMPGFKQYQELPAYYGCANVFIHASTTEQWGLVVNEAMASGLPVLVSKRCGCAPDLVQEGVNGFTFDPLDVEQLAQLMLKISAFRFPLSAFGSESRRIIAGWGAERFADGMQQAVASALRYPSAKSWLVDSLCLSALTYMLPGQPAAEAGSRKSHKMDPPPRRGTDYLVFCYQGRDVLAVPDRPAAVRLAGLKMYQPFTRKRQLYRVFMSAVLRLGGARLLATSRPAPVVRSFGFDFDRWHTDLEAQLGRSLPHLVVSWPSQPARHRLYVYLLDADLRAFAFVKLVVLPADHARLGAEAETLRGLSPLPLQRLRVPKLLRHECSGTASYLVLEALPAAAHPLPIKADWDASLLVAEYCGQRQRRSAPEICKLSWWAVYEASLQPGHLAYHEELLRLLPLGAEVCRAHGDLSAANMVTDGERVWLFDWELSHPAAPALTDVLGAVLSFQIGPRGRHPATVLQKLRVRFWSSDSDQQRLDVMLALAFRHASGIPDAGRLMEAWRSVCQ